MDPAAHPNGMRLLESFLGRNFLRVDLFVLSRFLFNSVKNSFAPTLPYPEHFGIRSNTTIRVM